MKRNMTVSEKQISDAEALVRKILIDDAGQILDDETVKTVAGKIVRGLPRAQSSLSAQKAAA